MEEETDWSQISRIGQRSYIKIETLWGKSPTKIHNALHEVCGDSVVYRSTVSRWASCFHEGRVSIQDDPRSERPVTATDNTFMVIVSTLLEENWHKSCEEIVHEVNMSTASIFRIVTQNLAEEKSCCKVGSASAERRTESSSQEGRRRTVAALRGRRWAVFEQKCYHRWNMDTRFWTTNEISVVSVEARNFSSPEKMSLPTIESSAHDDYGLWQERSVGNRRVPTGSTVTAAYYRKFLQDVLHPQIRQKSPPCSQPVSSLWMITRGLMPQVQFLKFWKSMDGKCFPTCRTVLTMEITLKACKCIL